MYVYNRYGRRRPRWRVTGRFYVFITIVFVLVLMLCVWLSTRGRVANPESNRVVFDPNTAVVQDAEPQYTMNAAQQPGTDAMQQPDPYAAAPAPVDEWDATQQADEWDAEPAASAPQTEAVQDPAAQQTTVPIEELAKDIQTEVPNQQNPDLIAKAGARTDLPVNWINILLLASDTRDPNKLSSSLCDSIMVVSVNKDTGQLKMMSIMRDMMIECPGVGMTKVNALAQHGGIQNMINVINTNLGLNITDYALVDFGGMARIIDYLGGIMVNITQDEMKQINRNMGQIAVYTMEQQDYLSQRKDMLLTTWGEAKRLNGIQAVTYARIRYIDNDMRRVERQQNVIKAMMDGVKDASIITLTQIGTTVLQYMRTNVSLLNGANYAFAVLRCQLPSKEKVKSWRIPGDETAKYEDRGGTEAFYDVNYPELQKRVYRWIYET